MIPFRLNPDLDVDALAATYAKHSFVQIADLFPDEVARALHEALVRQTPWRLSYPDEQRRPVALTQDQIERLGPEEVRRRMAAVMQRAGDGFGYVYYAHPVYNPAKGASPGAEPGHPLHDLKAFLNGPEFLDFGRRVIGDPAVAKVSGQATYFTPGHFLTRHVDQGQAFERRAAYTIGMSRPWEPDWGGWLTFFDERMDVRAYPPRYNTLTIFDGMRSHSVSAVAPFARSGRYSVVGWLLDDT